MDPDDLDGDNCRICRSGPELGSPLYHPCKCTGSIRFCHQDCLMEWLQHSRKKYCELCNHPFIFHKKYRKDMPTDGKLPSYLYLRRLFIRSAQVAKVGVRAALVIFTWLAVLPYINIVVWRFLFWSADVTAWMLLPGNPPPSGLDVPSPVWASTSQNQTSVPASFSNSSSSNSTNFTNSTSPASADASSGWFSSPSFKATLQRLMHDCFEGQVLTCVIVVLFVGIFLLREWIMQNVPQQLEQIAQPPPQNDAAVLARAELRDQLLAARAELEAQLAQQQGAQGLPEGEAPVAGNDAEADMQAQFRQAALAMRLAQFQGRPPDQVEAHRQMLIEALNNYQQQATRHPQEQAAHRDQAQVEPNDHEEPPQTVDQLREMRLRRFGLFPQSGEVGENATFTNTSREEPPSPAFRFGFQVDELAHVTQQAREPSESLERQSTDFPSSAHADSPLPWHSWQTGQVSTESEAPRSSIHHQPRDMEINASSTLVASWKEGSANHDYQMASNLENQEGGHFHGDSSTEKGKMREHVNQNFETSDSMYPRSWPPNDVASGSDAYKSLFQENKSELIETVSELETFLRHRSDQPWNQDPDIEAAQSGPASLQLEEAPVKDVQGSDGVDIDHAREGHSDESSRISMEGFLNEDGDWNQAEDPQEQRQAVVPLDIGNVAEIRQNHQAIPQANQDNAAARAVPNDDAVEPEDEDPDAEVGFAEEMDGIMEAVGMQGPLIGILQNLFLMIMLCAVVMFSCVSLPYLLGKVLGPGPRLVKILAFPIKILRFFTDPVFDAFIHLSAKIFSHLKKLRNVPTSTLIATKPSTPSISTRIFDSALSTLGKETGQGTAVFMAKAATDVKAPLWLVDTIQLLDDPVYVDRLKHTFHIVVTAGIYGCLEKSYAFFQHILASLEARTFGTSSMDRAFCVAFGLSYWVLMLAIQRQITRTGSSQSAGQESTIKMIIDQQVLIIKVVVFIFIELILFPLGCGLLLDFCLMPLFAQASVSDWADRLSYAPLTFAFTRWMGGTVYMFLFAQYVHATRSILRPGVLCWIRDPNDPGFHPIKEILDKKSLVQLRKIAASAVMYAAILFAVVGFNTFFLRYLLNFSCVLPLRWKPMDPFTEIPLDLLAIHLALPWLTKQVDFEKIFSGLLKAWWKRASRMMRLSAYMLGESDSEVNEKGKYAFASWKDQISQLWKSDPSMVEGARFVSDGVYCRVPADDKAVTSGPLIIPVSQDGTPIHDRGAEAIHDQEEAMKKMTTKPTYTVLYMPPRYRLRITLMLGLLWMTHSAVFIIGLSLPLLVGRWGFLRLARWLKSSRLHEPHDFYSLALGTVLIVTGFWLTRASKKLLGRAKSRSKRAGTNPYLFVAVSLKRRSVRLFKALLLLIGTGGVVPLLVGLTINQYIIVPIRFAPTTVPEVELSSTWALGLVELKLIHTLLRSIVQPTSGHMKRVLDGFDEISNGGFRKPKLWSGYRKVVAPIVLACIVLLVGPPVTLDAMFAWVNRYTKGETPRTTEQEQILLRSAYGIVLLSALLAQVHLWILHRMESWTDLLKDEIFLESTELKNYDPPSSSLESESATAKSKSVRPRTASIGSNSSGISTSSGPRKSVTDTTVTKEEEKDGEKASTDAGPSTTNQNGSTYQAEGTLPDVLLR